MITLIFYQPSNQPATRRARCFTRARDSIVAMATYFDFRKQGQVSKLPIHRITELVTDMAADHTGVTDLATDTRANPGNN